MKDIFKYFLMMSIRFLLKIFYIFPVKNNYILFSSFEGRQYSCNPKYLFQKISSKFSNQYHYIWTLNKKDGEDLKRLLEDIEKFGLSKKNVKTVKFLSLTHIYYYLTCKYIISNLNLEPFIPKRANQLYLATWHASGAYKNMDFSCSLKPTLYKLSARDFRSRKINYYIAGCKAFKDVYIKTWNTDADHFISTGLPRNDIFFESADALDKRKSTILPRLSLDETFGYVLFAPTYRGLNNHNHKSFDFELNVRELLAACEKRFNKPFKMLVKNHVDTESSRQLTGENIIDVSWYSDMQELMLASDILITDYSSSIWDFALLSKPAFLYTPDLGDYLKERGFYTPIDDWPFDYAETNAKLLNLILNYDENRSKLKINHHFELLGSYDSGTACEQVIQKLGF